MAIFPESECNNMAVGGYTDIENLISDLELFEVEDDPNYAPKWISVLAYLTQKAPVPMEAEFQNDTH